jgi:hypothetical protein
MLSLNHEISNQLPYMAFAMNQTIKLFISLEIKLIFFKGLDLIFTKLSRSNINGMYIYVQHFGPNSHAMLVQLVTISGYCANR